MKGNRIDGAKPGDVVLLQKLDRNFYFFDHGPAFGADESIGRVCPAVVAVPGTEYFMEGELHQFDDDASRVSEICILSTAAEMVNDDEANRVDESQGFIHD